MDIEADKFKYEISAHHSHEGSMGNLRTEEIKKQMQKVVGLFPFSEVEVSLRNLLK